jgi:hypothetical protein
MTSAAADQEAVRAKDVVVENMSAAAQLTFSSADGGWSNQ